MRQWWRDYGPIAVCLALCIAAIAVGGLALIWVAQGGGEWLQMEVAP